MMEIWRDRKLWRFKLNSCVEWCFVDCSGRKCSIQVVHVVMWCSFDVCHYEWLPWQELYRDLQLWGVVSRRLHNGRIYWCYCWQSYLYAVYLCEWTDVAECRLAVMFSILNNTVLTFAHIVALWPVVLGEFLGCIECRIGGLLWSIIPASVCHVGALCRNGCLGWRLLTHYINWGSPIPIPSQQGEGSMQPFPCYFGHLLYFVYIECISNFLHLRAVRVACSEAGVSLLLLVTSISFLHAIVLTGVQQNRSNFYWRSWPACAWATQCCFQVTLMHCLQVLFVKTLKLCYSYIIHHKAPLYVVSVVYLC